MERVTMPQLGETVTEGTITRWLKAEGDAVAVDESLFEVSTDKVDTEVPSAFGGYLRRILVAEGDTVPIHAVLAIITETADEAIDLPAEDREPATTAAGTPAVAASNEGMTARTNGSSTTATRATSERRRNRMHHRLGTGEPSGVSDFLSPVVRRLLDERGLDAGAVVGTGRDGRITRADVLAAAAQRTTPVTATPSSASPEPSTPALVAGPDDEIVPFSKARALTAEHMVRSRATSAHALLTVEVDYHAVDRVRRDAGLSYLPFVARAVVDGLATHPHLNASVGNDCLIVHKSVHLGIAVDLDREALIVPVVRDADGKRIRAVANEIADLADRGRRHRLTMDELTGATFTITNVGGYGTVSSAPIINQPQVAILSIDGIKPRPVASMIDSTGGPGDWSVTVHPVGNLSLAFDHRAVDGAYAASFLAHVRSHLETRDWKAEVR